MGLFEEDRPMTQFEDRERAFENKFAHDEEMKFRANARRNKMVGLWAAGVLGKKGEEAEAYALEVVRADFSEPGHEDVVRKLKADLGDRCGESEIRKKMEECLVAAKDRLLREVD
jgi:hypothetical protein